MKKDYKLTSQSYTFYHNSGSQFVKAKYSLNSTTYTIIYIVSNDKNFHRIMVDASNRTRYHVFDIILLLVDGHSNNDAYEALNWFSNSDEEAKFHTAPCFTPYSKNYYHCKELLVFRNNFNNILSEVRSKIINIIGI